MRRVLALAGLILSLGSASAQSESSPPLLSALEIDAVFADRALTARVLEIEAAMARAQAAEGVIPQAAAQAITEAAILETVSEDALAAEYAIVRHRMVALLNVLRRSLHEDSARYLHYGATTVDMYDTAAVLQMREATLQLIADLRTIELQLIALAEAHRDTPMVGRTLGQHALPITFGKKLSVYIGENRRHIDRLHDLLDRIERSAILKGAVGSYLGLGPQAMAVEDRFGRELGLADPYEDDWHAARDVMAEFVLVGGMISRSWARFGQEIFLLQSTDIGELVETRPASVVGSSTLPHKSNPSLSEALIHRGRVVPRLADIVADDMVNFFERDNTSRPNRAVAEVALELELQLRDASRLIGRLEVFPGRMRANLDRSEGWILSQRIVFALTDRMPREDAETAIRELAAHSRSSGASLAEALADDPVLSALLPPAERAALLDAGTYLGLAAAQTDAVIAAALTARETDRSQ